MTNFIPPRLRKPILLALAGAIFAVAWVVRGGPTWWLSILVVVVTAPRLIVLYVRGGKDTDEGALAGSRADERLKLLAGQSWAVAGQVAMAAAFIGLVIAIAVRGNWWWPFAIMIGVTGLGYLFGLSNYGVGAQDPADDEADAEHGAPFPVS
jgi:fatty acid desaturase